MGDFKIVSKKAKVDQCYGLYEFHITKEEIEALLSGKKLYSTVSYDEYAITIEMEGEDESKDVIRVISKEERIKQLKAQIWKAGDRHDWDECDRLEKELEELEGEDNGIHET